MDGGRTAARHRDHRAAWPGRYSAAFGGNARATIHTAPAYPARRPPVWQHDPATEWPTPISAERYYAERYTFHGPGIGGMVAVHAVGQRHVRGLLRTPPAPGGLLDSGLQMVGNWLRVTQSRRQISFPMRFGSVRFFGPPPAEGSMIECVGRVTAMDDRDLTFDVQYTEASTGQVWAVLEDALHRRYDTPAPTRLAEVFPGRNAASVRQPGGWVALFDYWPDPGTLLTIAQSALGSRGFGEFDRQPVAQRKRWLMGRIAVKDAARYLLWDGGAGEVFPVEVRVQDAADGRARVEPWPERGIPPFGASYAVAGEVAVAIAAPSGAPAPSGLDAGPGGTPVGISVADLTAGHGPQPGTLPAAEAAVLDAAAAAEPGCGRDVWLVRFQVARQAAARAHGAGPVALIPRPR